MKEIYAFPKPKKKRSSKVKKLEKNRVTLTRGECWVCKTQQNLQKHEIFGGRNRQLSMRYGMVVNLCQKHHTDNTGVHHNSELNEELKRWGQKKFNEIHEEDFVKIFGKNYL